MYPLAATYYLPKQQVVNHYKIRQVKCLMSEDESNV
jgi:hypothetical protein